MSRLHAIRTLTGALALSLFLAAAGCEDPLASLQQVKQAANAGGLPAPAATEDFSDDESAKAAANGISLGPEQAKRLYYQFIDAKGGVRFVERLADVPVQWRPRVGFVEMDSAPPLSPAMAEETRTRRYAKVADKYRPAVVAKMPASVVLYSADWCGWCKKAKRHLDAKGINYEIRDIDHPANLDELVAKTGQRGIPVLDVGGKIVTGFSPDRYDELIRTARG